MGWTSGGGGTPGTTGWHGEVADYASLPAAADHTGEIYLVLNSTGFLWNRRRGLYRSNGSAWSRLSKTTFEVLDTESTFVDDADNTKKMEFQLSAITTGTTRTMTIPDEDGTLVVSDTALTDNTIIRGDGGATGVQDSGITIDDSDNITGVGYIDLTAITAPAHNAGMLFYDTDDDELCFYNSESDVKLNIGTESWIKVRNDSGGDIADFTPVYATGAIGKRVTIAKAQANAFATSEVIGITTHTIENNTDGFITAFGTVSSVDTDGSPHGESWNDGDVIYLSATAAGGMTKVEPAGNNYVKKLGFVLVADNNGNFHTSIDGADMNGSASSTDNAIVRFDGNTGKRTQDSGVLIDDSDNITGVGTVDGVDISTHDHSGAGQGGTVDHVNLANIGTNTHAQIDTHIAATTNPHSTDIGNLGSGTLAELNSAVTDATLLDTTAIQFKTGSLHAASDHQNGGSLEISVAGLNGELADAQPVAVSKNSGATVGTRSTLNFIEGTDISLTIADDAGGDEVDITIASSAAASYPTYIINADMLEFPNSADWTVNANAQLATDSNNAAFSVMRFDDTTEEGVGFTLYVPTGATNIVFNFCSRAETAPGSAQTVALTVYNRELLNNSAVESWTSATQLTDINIPTNEYWQYDSESVALSTLGITAGNYAQFELTRDTADAGDTLSGDWTLLLLRIGFS